MPPAWVLRLLSWIWPITVERTEGAFGPLQLRWEYGRLALNTPNANQSFGSLHRVWQHVLREELGSPPPRNVLALGLGGGSVVHILRKELRLGMPITIVELDPVMVNLARTRFELDTMKDVRVITGDATIQVHALQERFDLVLVDLFEDLDMARGIDSRAFVQGLRERCAEGGKVCFNTVGHDARSKRRCDKIKDLLCDAFDNVREWRTEDLNRVFVAA
jgi:spermidine synthase